MLSDRAKRIMLRYGLYEIADLDKNNNEQVRIGAEKIIKSIYPENRILFPLCKQHVKKNQTCYTLIVQLVTTDQHSKLTPHHEHQKSSQYVSIKQYQ